MTQSTMLPLWIIFFSYFRCKLQLVRMRYADKITFEARGGSNHFGWA